MIAKWLSDTVTSFGELLGFRTFTLNDRGVAGITFETGVTFRIEVAYERLVLCVGIPAERLTREQAERLLGEAHPFFPTAFGRIRAGYVAHSQKALLTTFLPTESADAASLDRAFRELWDRGERLRRALWA